MQGMLIGVCVTILYIAIVPYFFKYAVPQYLDGLRYAQILGLAFVFALPNRYVSQLFLSQGFSREIFITETVNSIVLMLLYCTLGITGGLMGLVIAQVAFNGFAMVLNIVMWRIRTGKTF